MFTLSLLYVIFYLFTFLGLFLLSFSQLPLYILTQFSIVNSLIFIQKYKTTKPLYFWLFFSLTGLPPVGLFFIKFNIFFFILYQAHFAVICLIFLVFFLNMLFYLQVFNFRNYKKSLYSVITPNLLNVWHNKSYKTNLSNYNNYFLILTVINTILFISLTIIFLTDYYLIFNLI